MSIIASVALLLMVSVSTRGQTAGPCVSNTFICSDCTNLGACFGGVVYPIPCAAGQVCGNDGVNPTIDSCFDIAESSNTKQSQCSCDASATAPSYKADGLSEDPAAYLACLPGSSAPESLVCTVTDEVFLDGQVPPCGAADPTTTAGPTTTPPTTPAPFECTGAGFIRDSSSCSTYWLCQADSDTNPTEANCADGESFNEGTLKCFDPCDPSAETFSCDGITGGVIDSVDCEVFHICVNGVAIGMPVPCPTGEKYDTATSACTATAVCGSADDVCLACVTTPAPPTTAGQTGATPDADSSTSGSDSSTSGSDSSTSGSDSSTSGSDSSTSGSDSSTPGADSSTSGSDSSTSGSDSSTPGADSSTINGSPSSNSPTSESPSSDDDDDDESTSSPTPTSGSTIGGSPTTTAGSTAGGVTGVPDCTSTSQAGYYDNGPCASEFYSCEDDDEGGFVLKEYTCPGSLIFDTNNNYCNLVQLVPGC